MKLVVAFVCLWSNIVFISVLLFCLVCVMHMKLFYQGHVGGLDSAVGNNPDVDG